MWAEGLGWRLAAEVTLAPGRLQRPDPGRGKQAWVVTSTAVHAGQ